jgi:predicted Zn-dependent protease
MFLYLHELGHHVLGHTDGVHLNDSSGLAMSREQETAADRYALMTALKAQYNLVNALPWNLFMASFGGNSIESEQVSDHPLGIKRVLTMFNNTIDYYSVDPNRWPDPDTYDAFMTNLKSQKAQIKSALNQIEH